MRLSHLTLCALLLPFLSAPLRACLQDRDTLETEARGVPDVVRALSGRFERNPPLFYEMRMQRVERELQSAPERLDLYDDIAVATDRLGRSDEALAWAAKKRARLQVLDAKKPEVREHWYRYWANVGTFRVHRWIHDGADRSKLGEVKQARDEIARAIAIKPGAHFGREKYQLRAMEWILKPPSTKDTYDDLPNLLSLPEDYLPMGHGMGQAELKKRGYEDAERGLTGLITLGAAWQSVDVFNALRHVEAWQSNSSIVYLLNRRLEELALNGRASLHPQAPRDRELVKRFDPQGEHSDRLMMTLTSSRSDLDGAYKRLRDEANAWHARRMAFMLERHKAGRHPDTDSAFWNGWDDGTPPLLRPLTRWEVATERLRQLSPALTVLLLACGSSTLVLLRKRSKRLAQPAST